jgi:hypothetical protein
MPYHRRIMSSSPLAVLERLRRACGPEAARAKGVALDRLERARLGSAAAVRRLHEVLCHLRAYPDDEALLAQVRRMLEGFERRADLRAHRPALADSGIAGTAIHYRFFAAQAQWLARHWPQHLRLDRRDAEADARIARALLALLTPFEIQALIELKPSGYAALDRVRGAGETDAVFLLRRIAALPGDSFVREAFSDTMDASYTLEPGPHTPSRTHACWDAAPVVLRRAPPARVRPDLLREIVRAPRAVRRLSSSRAQPLIDLARGAMVTRARSLEAFSYADARDAWLVDDGDGLVFALFGVQPERRHFLASWYGGLTLRNGVPIGYVQSDHVGDSAALSFNTFETFRGGEAAFSFARWLAALHHLFGTRSFSIEPYQLGAKGNDEGLVSGAWWFYATLGFAPRDAATLALAKAELQRAARRPRYRSGAATLRRLAERHLFFDLDPARPRPLIALGELGLAAGAALSARAGADRAQAVDQACAQLLGLCGAPSLRGWSAAQREALRRMAPWLLLLDLAAWSPDERCALLDLVQAKAARSEREFVARVGRHPRLLSALAERFCV